MRWSGTFRSVPARLQYFFVTKGAVDRATTPFEYGPLVFVREENAGRGMISLGDDPYLPGINRVGRKAPFAPQAPAIGRALTGALACRPR